MPTRGVAIDIVENHSFSVDSSRLFDLIHYVLGNSYAVMSGRSYCVGPVLSKDKCVLLKDTTQ